MPTLHRLVLAGVVAALAACHPAAPPECTFDTAVLSSDTSGLAKKKVAAALEEAKAAAAAQDPAQCAKAQQSVALAKEAVARAGRAKAELEKQAAAADAALAEARVHVKNAVAWIDAVPSSPEAEPTSPMSKVPAEHVDLPGQVRAFEKALDDDENRVKREKDAAALAGYDVAPEVMMSLARALEARGKYALVLEVEARKAALARCKPKVEVNGVDALEQFLVMKAPTATLFYVVDPETHACRLVHTEKRSLDVGALALWKPKKPQPTSVLVGWGKDDAVFVGEGGGFALLKHPAGCAAPTIGDTVEATCDGGHARYIWDGSRAVAEQ